MPKPEEAVNPAVVLPRLLDILERKNVLSSQDLGETVAPTQKRLPETQRTALIDSVMGKYKDVPTSSDAFIKRKHAELATDEDTRLLFSVPLHL